MHPRSRSRFRLRWLLLGGAALLLALPFLHGCGKPGAPEVRAQQFLRKRLRLKGAASKIDYSDASVVSGDHPRRAISNARS